MRKLLPYFILIFILSLPAVRFLFGPGYFNMHDDLQVMRIFQLEKCLADGQIPCRWVPDMAYGYGQAMFNFYSAFPYYLGVFFRIITPLSIMGTVKLLFLVALVGAGFGMFFLARQFWGNRGGVLAAVLYTYAPYHALDIFVRGALAEAFALAILPFLWLGLYLLAKKPTFTRAAATALSLAALLTTHNISTLIFAPFTLAWTLFWLFKFREARSIVYITTSGVLGIGLASFFFIPVIFERSLIQTEFLIRDYLYYPGHFVAIRQLFLDRGWGYGPSKFGPDDDLSFQIGWPHWWLGIPLALIGLKRRSILLLGLLGFAAFTSFLTHLRSIFIWQTISIMAFVQFPWRFLGLVIFFISFAGGALAKYEFRYRRTVVIVAAFLAIVLNRQYFKPYNYSPVVTDEQKLSGEAFLLQQKSAILDYLPKTSPKAPEAPAPENPQIISGAGEISNFQKKSNSFSFDAEIFEEAEVHIPVMYFPGWKVIVDNKIIPAEPAGEYGAIGIRLLPGKYIIQGRFEDTPVRSIANTVTLISGLALLAGFVLEANKKKV